MAKKLLIDAKQPEETRVVLLNGNRIEDFDQETTTKLQNKGNIYLARVTRVEPSLQAAFIEYGGNRHGFLAFSEIHPDYYRIPIEDRKALTEEMLKAEEQNSEEIISEEMISSEQSNSEEKDKIDTGHQKQDVIVRSEEPETIGGVDETASFNQTKAFKRYKIQEVISKRQILLVQVAKEERGNKGAALTTYISLAGRYCVLMPNTIRGGGVSRKINKIEDRKRLKSIIESMKMPEGMAVIIRTAGSDRTKAELKKDFVYLQNLWNIIREKTLKSTAPILINEEGNLIKRTIRDLYNKDVNEILVSGNQGFDAAKEYIKLMIPNHIKRVKNFEDDKSSLFQKFNVEKQLDAIHLPSVKLKSGGYLVINQTEALVAIDVNSGRATKERNIEETALKTNLEAAEEVARQLKLRDLSGLIVIDFIDMDGYKNQTAVEKKLKESMSLDRARIQIGRISHFGLLELSRQRLRPSVSENYFSSCSACGGTGIIRSVESSVIRVLRKIEEAKLKNQSIQVFVPSKIGMYILNQKRQSIQEIEKKLNLNIIFEFDDTDIDLDCKIERKGNLKPIEKLKSSNETIEVKEIEETQQQTKVKRTNRSPWKKNKVAALNGDVKNTHSKNKKYVNDTNDKSTKRSTKDEKDHPAVQEDNKTNPAQNKIVVKNSEIKSTQESKIKVKRSSRKIKQENSFDLDKKTKINKSKNQETFEQTTKNFDDVKKDLDKNKSSNNGKVKTTKRPSKSSEPLDVVDVDNSTKTKRGGWWSQTKS